eukprot:3086028-Pyramimonas_sp.AAC.1
MKASNKHGLELHPSKAKSWFVMFCADAACFCEAGDLHRCLCACRASTGGWRQVQRLASGGRKG